MSKSKSQLEEKEDVTVVSETEQLELGTSEMSGDQGNIHATTSSLSVEWGEVLEAIQSLSVEFQKLQQGFDSKIKYDASKERVIDTLHKELQIYREELHFKILRPIFLDMISMHDDFSNLSNYDDSESAGYKSEPAAKLRESLMSFQETLEDILNKYEVEVYNEAGDRFVPQRQRAIKRVETNDPAKDRLVAERIRKGFAYEGKVLRPEVVAIYKLIEQQTDD